MDALNYMSARGWELVLQGAECAARGVGSDVLFDAGGGGDAAKVFERDGRGEHRRHFESMAPQYAERDRGERYLERIIGFFLDELHIPGFAGLDEFEMAVAPIH